MIEKVADTAYDIHDLLKKRWSPRAFSNKPVPHDALQRLIEAARWAPSCFNVQPWRYIIATKENKQAYAAMLGCLVEKNQMWAQSAPVLMLGLTRKTFEVNDNPNGHAEHDLGLATSQLTVQALHEGLYVHQMAGIQRDKIRETYQVPAEYEPLVGIAIGYQGELDTIPADFHEAEKSPSKRKLQSEIAFTGSFGNPWS